jgi:hypothetical protein
VRSAPRAGSQAAPLAAALTVDGHLLLKVNGFHARDAAVNVLLVVQLVLLVVVRHDARDAHKVGEHELHARDRRVRRKDAPAEARQPLRKVGQRRRVV